MNIIKKIISVLPSTRRFVERRISEQEKIIQHVLDYQEKLIALQEKMLSCQDKILNAIGDVASEQNIIKANQDTDRKIVMEAILDAKENCIDSSEKVLFESRKYKEEMLEAFNAEIGIIDAEISVLDEKIRKGQDSIKNSLLEKSFFWDNPFEKRIVEANWGDVSSQADFSEKFLRLIAGLDETSVDCIERIISRQHNYLNSKNSTLKNVYTLSEQRQLRLLEDEFFSRIFQVGDELFAYKKYLLPINHFEASVFYYRHGLDNISIPDSLKNKSIIDVGGFIGDSILVLDELPHKNIISFEAEPCNYKLMKKTIEINHLKNVICENVALGSSSGEYVLHRKGAMSTLSDRRGLQFEDDIIIPVIRFDDYVSNNNINCGLIKVDIEGAEREFLSGAQKTICSQKPILIISIYHNSSDFFDIKPMIEKWDLGYRFSVYKPVDGNTTSETLLIATI